MPKNSLLPERHPNADFFIADIFDSLPVKNDRHTMEHPFFTLSTQPDFRVVQYSKNGVNIKLVPHATLGLPTMMDKDILLYVGSLMMAEINKGITPPKRMRFSVHDLLVTTNRETNGKGYMLVKKAFERITGALITTDIRTSGFEEYRGFHILDGFGVIESSHDNKRMVRAEITISDWFYNALAAKEVLTINRDYFRLRKTLERRLYELARKHCGKQAEWSIGLENLHEKCGVRSPLKTFRHQIKTIIKTDTKENHFPDYRLKLDDTNKVTFINRLHEVRDMVGNTTINMFDMPHISPETLRKGATIVERAGTGWDYREIRNQFTLQLQDGFKPDNVNAAFIGFVKKKAAQRP